MTQCRPPSLSGSVLLSTWGLGSKIDHWVVENCFIIGHSDSGTPVELPGCCPFSCYCINFLLLFAQTNLTLGWGLSDPCFLRIWYLRPEEAKRNHDDMSSSIFSCFLLSGATADGPMFHLAPTASYNLSIYLGRPLCKVWPPETGFLPVKPVSCVGEHVNPYNMTDWWFWHTERSDHMLSIQHRNAGSIKCYHRWTIKLLFSLWLTFILISYE